MRWWFEKNAPALGAETVALEQRMRYNPLQGVDPDVLVSAITEFDAGGLGRLARIVETFERRDDTMRTASRKMLASVARCAHSVLIVEGEEDNPRALEHQKTLRRFWARVRATSAFSRNAVGGMRLLKRQMAGAQSLCFAVHEIVWRPQADGTIAATFVHVPLEHFENRTGELRFLRRTSDYEGIPMEGGEWLVTVGDGVGIAAAVAAMSKHLSLQDWLLYSERCGQPGLHARTSAAKGSDAWNTLVRSVRNFGREWALVTDQDTQMTPISLASGGTLPYPELIRRMDQAIAALYRGADLSTISGGSGEVGATLQGEESNILEQDACEMLSETLQEQVDRYVIRYTYGDEEPLAYVQIAPVANPNLDREMQVDKHLAGLGVKLSKDEALQRYQRTEAKTDDDALSTPANTMPSGTETRQLSPQDIASLIYPLRAGGYRIDQPTIEKAMGFKVEEVTNGGGATPAGLANEAMVALRNAAETPSAGETALARALQADLRPVAERLRDLLQEEGDFAAACKRLREELPDLLREIGQEESEFAKTLEGILGGEGQGSKVEGRKDDGTKDGKAEETALANSTQVWHKCPRCGKFDGFDGHCGKCGFVLEGKEARARTAALLDKAARDDYAKPVQGIAYREELGRIDLEVGKWGEFVPGKSGGGEWQHGRGLSKIRHKHGTDMEHLPDTLAFGTILRTRTGDSPDAPEDPDRRAIAYNGYVAFVNRTGKDTWAITTHWKPKNDMVATLVKIAETLKDSAIGRRQVQ